MLLFGVIGLNARAAEISIRASGSSPDLAFARYIASNGEGDPFEKSGTVIISIEASLPELYKSAAVLAVRTPDEDERGDLHIVQIAGDGTVTAEVIDRVFAMREQIDLLPLSSIAITPVNYKFHLAGKVKTGGSSAYIYDITPKKNRPGLVLGQLWMDSGSGQEVMLSGRVMNLPDTSGPVNVVRDTKLANGSAFARVTHVAWSMPRLGRAEVVITEIVLTSGMVPQPERLDVGQ